jgi:hypothetical protein
MEPSGEMITSPYHMAVVEQLRHEVADETAESERVPTDVFVFAKGEPTDRRSTKIGGIPFWPKKLNWPRDNTNKPLRFVAQFSFADSRFLFDDLPGDLLAIFGESGGRSPRSLEFNWIQSGDGPPVGPKEIPHVEGVFLPLYGVLHRTYDYVDDQPAYSRYHRSYLLSQVEGTKIGGNPRWIQGDEELPGRYLCTLGSILPESGRPFPYVNQKNPIGFSEQHDRRLLMWGDVGNVHLFLQQNGEIRSAEQCY